MLNLEFWQEQKINKLLNIFETDSPLGNYSCVAVTKDAPDGESQISYGRIQSAEFGSLERLLLNYSHEKQALYSMLIQPFIKHIGQNLLHKDIEFKKLLKLAGTDPAMQRCQDKLVGDKYFYPAKSWCARNNYELPLTVLVVFDSYIHSGRMLPFLLVNVKTPKTNEKKWITEYCVVRLNWLKNHVVPLLNKTVYRPECFLNQIKLENWDLSKIINFRNHKI